KGNCVGDCQNGFGYYKYDNGDSYVGFFTNGKRDHLGAYSWKSGMAHIAPEALRSVLHFAKPSDVRNPWKGLGRQSLRGDVTEARRDFVTSEQLLMNSITVTVKNSIDLADNIIWVIFHKENVMDLAFFITKSIKYYKKVFGVMGN